MTGIGKSVRTQLYRHYDKHGRLLYVGISLSAVKRLAAHRAGSDWARAIYRVQIQTFTTRAKALKAELRAIKNEGPLFNIQGAPAAPDAPHHQSSRSRVLMPKLNVEEKRRLIDRVFGHIK
jgi:hypothetical protein